MCASVESGGHLTFAMLSRRVLLTTSAGLLVGAVCPARAAGMVWVGAEIPPYLRQGPGGPEGYAFELFQRVLKQAGLRAELSFFPWARAMRMVQRGEAQAALVMTRSPERGEQFHWLFPIGSYRFAVFSRAEDGPLPAELGALKSRRIGSLRASASRHMLSGAGFTSVVEGKDYPELLMLLRRRVVDVIIGPEQTLRAASPQSDQDLRRTVLEPRRELYAGAGRAMPEDVRLRLIAAYQHLVDTGVVAQLRHRHPEILFAD